MLELQRFIIDHPASWKERLEMDPYNLKIEEKGNLVLFKYNQISSDFSYDICKEARGIILERDSWRVVRMAFKKFFNLGETHAAKMDWASARVTEKMDGSLISLYYYNSQWNVATNGCINAHDAELNNGGFKTFYDLFMAALPTDFDWNKLNPHYTYTFELVGPYNRIVVSYPKNDVYLICVRDNASFEEYSIQDFADDLHVKTPTTWWAEMYEDCQNIVDGFGDNTEGIVVQDKYHNRVKMKTPLYFQLHRMVNNGKLTTERALALIMANDEEEFLIYFPEYTDYFTSIRNQYERGQKNARMIAQAVQEWKNTYPYVPRGTFANWVKSNYPEFKTIAFLAYDDRLEQRMAGLDAKAAIRFYNIKE